MEACPRCSSKNAVFIDEDIWGWFKKCLICGWGKELNEEGQEIISREELIKLRRRAPLLQGNKT